MVWYWYCANKAASPSPPRTVRNICCYLSTKDTFTSNRLSLALLPISAPDTSRPTSSSVSSAIISKFRSSTTKILLPYSISSRPNTSSITPSHPTKSNLTPQNSVSKPSNGNFLSVLASTHPSFPINHWPELLPQAEMTLNLLHPYAALPTISVKICVTISLLLVNMYAFTIALASKHAQNIVYS